MEADKLTIPGLLLTAVGAEATVIVTLWRRCQALETQLKEEQKGRLADRDMANQVTLKLLSKLSGANLLDSEAKSPATIG